MRRLVLPIMVVTGLGIGGVVWLRRNNPDPPPPPPPELRRVWAFEAPRPGSAVATPLVTDDAIYLAAIHTKGFSLTGAVYALNPATGKPKWVFDRDGEMLPTASSPVLAGGRLFFGEGMHRNFVCQFYCLDSTTGKSTWTAGTGDHIEGGPAVEGGTVFFPAGNDGVYALDAATGTERWKFQAGLHIDSSPTVAGGRVYVGSGPSRKYQTTELTCLDAATGKPVWRAPLPLPAWVAPAVAGGRVFAGLGNGRLTKGAEPPETPAGGLACFDAATGASLWTVRVGDAVFGRPVVVGDRVVFGSRDGNLYGVSFDGKELFRVSLGGPVIAAPGVDRGRVYAASVPGRIVCLDPAAGEVIWQHELARAGATPHVYASPQAVGGRLYAAAEMVLPGSSAGIVSLFCFALPDADGRERGAR